MTNVVPAGWGAGQSLPGRRKAPLELAAAPAAPGAPPVRAVAHRGRQGRVGTSPSPPCPSWSPAPAIPSLETLWAIVLRRAGRAVLPAARPAAAAHPVEADLGPTRGPPPPRPKAHYTATLLASCRPAPGATCTGSPPNLGQLARPTYTCPASSNTWCSSAARALVWRGRRSGGASPRATTSAIPADLAHVFQALEKRNRCRSDGKWGTKKPTGTSSISAW